MQRWYHLAVGDLRTRTARAMQLYPLGMLIYISSYMSSILFWIEARFAIFDTDSPPPPHHGRTSSAGCSCQRSTRWTVWEDLSRCLGFQPICPLKSETNDRWQLQKARRGETEELWESHSSTLSTLPSSPWCSVRLVAKGRQPPLSLAALQASSLRRMVSLSLWQWLWSEPSCPLLSWRRPWHAFVGIATSRAGMTLMHILPHLLFPSVICRQPVYFPFSLYHFVCYNFRGFQFFSLHYN